MKWLAYMLVALLLGLQYELWFSRDGVSKTAQLKRAIALQAKDNEKIFQQNKWLSVKIQDLKQNGEAVELLAREKMGMIKQGETYYQLTAQDDQ